MDPPIGGLKKAKSIDPEAAATMVENDRRAKEGVCMSLADIESSVCMRSHSALTVTKSLCRTLLSSFHCDICLEVIASCRSCVPCGHSYCAPCIQGVINAAATGWNATAAKCPRCRTNVAQVIPNKTVDAAIADCLGNIREVSNTCKEMRMPATVSESQDISLWEERYEVNEAPTREVLIQQNAAAAAARAHEEEDEEDEDEDEQEYISCVNAEVEYARSGRATCIHCRSLIGNGEIRFGVFQQAEEYYQPTTKFIHLNCGSAFNSHRGDRESKIRLSSLRGLAALSAGDQTAVRTALRNYE